MDLFLIIDISNYIVRYACYLTFIFLLYNLIQRQSSSLGYNLLVKKRNWSDTYKVVNNILHNHLQAAATEIKATNKCIDPDIVTLEQQVQTIVSQVPHSYTRYLEHRFILKAMSVSYGFPVL